MENELKKRNNGLVVLVIILFILVIFLASYIVYERINNKEKKSFDNNVNNIISSDNTTNNVISDSSDNTTNNVITDDNEKSYDDLIKESEVDYEDGNYISYLYWGGDMCAAKEYIVYDKRSGTYLNDQIALNHPIEKITYFGQINGEYYYFKYSWKNNAYAHTDIFKIDGTMVESIDLTYGEYKEDTNEFEFSPCPFTVQPFYYWHPSK